MLSNNSGFGISDISIPSFEPNGIKVVLGNGFDLFCGLDTKYIHFFKSEKDKYEEISKWSKSFKDINVYISGQSANWKDFGPQYSVNIDFNLWDIYFTLAIGEKDYNWCDIETEMIKTFTDDGKINWSRVYNISRNRYNNLLNADYLEYILAGYIINKNPDISTTEKFYMFLLEELKKFEKNFGKYVSKEYNKNYDEYLKCASIFFSNLESLDEDVKSIETFNYTNNSAMRTYKPSNFLDDIKHINGDFNNPIFGVDSSRIHVDKPEVIFTKVSRRLINSTFHDCLIGSTFDEPFNNLVIFGHSLCEHDYSYFFPIFDYLEISNIMKTSMIIFAYNIYDDSKKEDIILDNIRKVTKLINQYENYMGKNKENRLMDSLTVQGRIKFFEIVK